MEIVILDGHTENPGDLSWEPIAQLGDLAVYDRTAAEDVVSRIGSAQIVVTNKTPITREILERCPSIQLIAVLATGYNVVDIAAARERGIPVCNVPSYGTEAVGQFAIALLLEICSHVGIHSQSVARGEWTDCPDFCYWKHPLIELNGKTMGIIGFGHIGQQTGKIARAMGMHILATGSRPTDSGREIAQYVELDTLLAQSDVICLHCPLLPGTERIINRETIARMKDGVILINNSRGQLIDEEALAEALNSGKVAAAGLDVVSTEPIRRENPLLRAKNCIITPHISWAPVACRQRILDRTAQNIRAFLMGKVENCVNGVSARDV